MKKYNVFFVGAKTYMANSEEDAISFAEADCEVIPSQFNLKPVGDAKLISEE